MTKKKLIKAETSPMTYEDIWNKKGLGETMGITTEFGEYMLDKNGEMFNLPIDDLIHMAEDKTYEPEWYHDLYEWAGSASGVVGKNIILLLADEMRNYKTK